MKQRAKVKSAASYAAIALRHRNGADKALSDARHARSAAAARKAADQKIWRAKRKHQRATIVVAAKAMKAASQKARSRNKAVANAALMAKRAERQRRKAAT